MYRGLTELGIHPLLPDDRKLRVRLCNQIALFLFVLGFVLFPREGRELHSQLIIICSMAVLGLAWCLNAIYLDKLARLIVGILPSAVYLLNCLLIEPEHFKVYRVVIIGASIVPLVLFSFKEWPYKFGAFLGIFVAFFVLEYYFYTRKVFAHPSVYHEINLQIYSELFALVFILVLEIMLEIALGHSYEQVRLLAVDLEQKNQELNRHKEELEATVQALSQAQRELEAAHVALKHQHQSKTEQFSTLEEMRLQTIERQTLDGAIARFAEILNHPPDESEEDWCNRALGFIIELTNGVAGSLYLQGNNDHDCYPCRAHFSLGRPSAVPVVYPGVGLLGKVVERKQLLTLEGSKYEMEPIVSGTTSFQVQTVILLPLPSNENIIGVLELALANKASETQLLALQRLGIFFASRWQMVQQSIQMRRLLDREKFFNTQLENTKQDLELKMSALFESEKSLRLIQAELKDQVAALNNAAMVIKIDSEGNILSVNEAFEALTGLQLRDLIGKSIRTLNISSSEAEFLTTVQHSLVKKGYWKGEVCISLDEERVHWVDVTVTPFIREQPEDTTYLIVALDITRLVTQERQLHELLDELKKRESELKRYNDELLISREQAELNSRAKQDFLAKMSHEMRTPLNGILGMAQLFSFESVNSLQQEYIKNIQLSAQNLLVLINDILDVSKIESGKFDFTSVEFNLKELVSQIEATLVHKVAENHNQLRLPAPKDLDYRLVGDPYRLNQILLNLLSNAAKFTHKGLIHLRVHKLAEQSPHTETLRFEVEDTGIGIPEEWLGRIFDNFVQVDHQMAIINKQEGTGLGLSIVRQLVELQGGKIGVESTVGKGTTFWVELSFGRPTPKTANSVSQTGTQSPESWEKTKHFQGLRVLVAEDHAINQVIIQRLFQQLKLEYTLANNGREAIKELENQAFDLLLLDIRMPEMDGYEVAKYIRHHQKAGIRKLPILAMTAHAFQEEREKCFEAGMNDYISKPIDFEELVEKILKLTNRHLQAMSTDHKQQVPRLEYDLEYIKEILGEGAEAMRGFFEETLRDLESGMQELPQAYRTGNLKSLSQQAHRLKSTFRFYNAKKAGATFEKLERISRTPIGEPQLGELVQEAENFLRLLHAELAEKSQPESFIIR
jgi:PAS domain S-box-containing protein